MKREVNAGPKKKWARPKLIVLIKGRPEEGVLAGCKSNQFFVAVSPNATYSWCSWRDVVVCHGCQQSAIS